MQNNKFKYVVALCGLLATITSVPTPAQTFSAPVLSELFKSTLNSMVVEVRKESEPTKKREILGKFINGMDEGLAKMTENPTLTTSDRDVIKEMAFQFHKTYIEFHALDGTQPILDHELDAYANFLQQKFEQAAASWNGGIYLSGGVLLLIIIFLLLFR